MKRLNETRYWIAAVALVLSAAYLLDIWITKQPTVYEKAQRATVIIKGPTGSTGSGSVVKRKNANGQVRLFLWTAAHVVDDGNDFKVEQKIRNENRKVGNMQFTARVIMRAGKEDIALLWLDAPEEYFNSVEFDSVPQRRIGDELYHVGNFLGSLDDSVSWGRISQFGIDGGDLWKTVDQADMLILPGSSGGPLFSADSNKVLGIVVGWPGAPGVNFYVPLRAIRAVGPDWALYGDFCPSDEALDKFVEKSKLVLKKNEPVLSVQPEPPAPESKSAKKGFRRFTFRGW